MSSIAQAGELDVADHFAIATLYARYARAIDSGDGAGYAACYTGDGEYVSSTFGQSTGSANLSIFAVEHYRRWIEQGIQTRHWNNQVLLERSTDGAVAGSVYVLLMGVKAGETPRMLIQTVYTDLLVRTAGGWKLRRRQSNADSRPDPALFGFSRWSGASGFNAPG